jgi:hypothetical protein
MTRVNKKLKLIDLDSAISFLEYYAWQRQG